MDRCVNCGIATSRCNTMRRRALDDEMMLSVFRQWLAPLPVNGSDYVCQACWSLAQGPSVDKKRQLGHRSVCLHCGRSLASRVSHRLHTGSPRELRIYNAIQSWIIPRIVEVASCICHTCWVAADRAAVPMCVWVSSPSTSIAPVKTEPTEPMQPGAHDVSIKPDEQIQPQSQGVPAEPHQPDVYDLPVKPDEQIQPQPQGVLAEPYQSGADDLPIKSDEQIQPQPQGVPAEPHQSGADDLLIKPDEQIQPQPQHLPAEPLNEEVGNNEPEPTIVLPDYMRAIETQSRCFIEGCQRTERNRVPLSTRKLLLSQYKYYVPENNRLCDQHLVVEAWDFLDGLRATYLKTFTAKHIQDMMSLK